jgi:hypothetical protein
MGFNSAFKGLIARTTNWLSSKWRPVSYLGSRGFKSIYGPAILTEEISCLCSVAPGSCRDRGLPSIFCISHLQLFLMVE